ncbi:MAG: hypothetical protein ABJL72_16635 [Roseobacter sp.]
MYKLFTFNADAAAPCPPSSPPLRSATNAKDEPALATAKALTPNRNSTLSQMSLVAKFMALDPIALDAFEERAAILEYDAGLSRADAEREAFTQVMQAFREA